MPTAVAALESKNPDADLGSRKVGTSPADPGKPVDVGPPDWKPGDVTPADPPDPGKPVPPVTPPGSQFAQIPVAERVSFPQRVQRIGGDGIMQRNAVLTKL